jgi:molybdopterin converting factor small subunit
MRAEEVWYNFFMKVKIRLYANLRNYGPEEQEAELPENATLEDAIKRLNLPERIPLLKIVNGEHRNVKHPLKEGDEIALFPPIAGGAQETLPLQQ